MKRRRLLLSLLWMALGVQFVSADTGKESIGQLKVSLFHGTDGKAASGGKSVTEAVSANLQRTAALKFQNYSLIGEDVQDILRSYEMWAKPSRTDEQFMVSYEPLGSKMKNSIRLDLELWWQKRKILKTDPLLKIGEPLYIRGPEWRKGRLIIAVELLKLK